MQIEDSFQIIILFFGSFNKNIICESMKTHQNFQNVTEILPRFIEKYTLLCKRVEVIRKELSES